MNKSIKFSIHGPMKCGSSEAESQTYHKYTGKSGKIWLVANQPNAADNVYVEGGKDSDGFAGRTLSFKLVDGCTLKLTGPWHSNADALFTDTGVDVRDKYLTQGIVALDRQYEDNDYHKPYIYSDVIHYDKSPVIGCFNRIETLAQEFANSTDKIVFYAFISSGGGSSGSLKPSGEK